MTSWRSHFRRLLPHRGVGAAFAPGRHAVQVREGDDCPRHAVATDREGVDPEALLAGLPPLLRGSRRRPREAALVLPRFEYAFKLFPLPLCDRDKLTDVVRNQVALNCHFGGEEACFDYQAWPESLSAAQEAGAARRTYAVTAARTSTIDYWRRALEAIDFKLTTVTTQTQVAAEAFGSDADDRDVLIVLADGDGVETLVARRQTTLATSFHEWSPEEAQDANIRDKALRRCVGALPSGLVVREIVVSGLHAVEIAEALQLRFVGAPCRLIPVPHAAESEGVNAWLPLDGLPTSVNLLQHMAVEDPGVAIRRRRRIVAAAGLLAVLGGAWQADARLRALDEQIARAAEEIGSTEPALARAETVGADFALMQAAVDKDRDWMADIDRICRTCEPHDAVALASLRAEVEEATRRAQFRVSGTAPDTALVTELMSELANDPTNAQVPPLGLRPLATAAEDSVEFQIRIVREPAPEKAAGAP